MADVKHISGLKELSDALKKLPVAVAERHLRLAVGAGAQEMRRGVLQSIVSSGIQKRTGTLERSVYAKSVKELSKSNEKVYFVGVRQGKKYGARKTKGGREIASRDAYWWWMLNFGTSKIPAKRFMEKAFEGKKNIAVDAIAARLKKGIDQEAAKVGKK